jgi:hypothetical protein
MQPHVSADDGGGCDAAADAKFGSHVYTLLLGQPYPRRPLDLRSDLVVVYRCRGGLRVWIPIPAG